MGRIDSYEAISGFTGNERIVVETDKGTRKALFSQIQDKINDCVEDKADMFNLNSVSVTKDTEAEYVLDITVGTTHITTPNLKGNQGRKGDTGPQGPPGKDGMRTYLAYTEEEFEIAVEEIFSDFTSKVPASIITMASFFGYSDSENRLLQLYLFDDGTGNPDNAILINSYIFDEALYKTVASQLPLEFAEYEKTYSALNTFDASVADAKITSIKMIVKLPDVLSLKQENVPGSITVRLNGYKDSFSMLIEQNIMDIGYFVAEASIEENSFIRLRMTLTDSTFNNVIRKEEFFKQVSGYENIERFIFSLSNFNFDANKKYMVNYFGKGGAAF